jgi:hypothetical protein
MTGSFYDDDDDDDDNDDDDVDDGPGHSLLYRGHSALSELVRHLKIWGPSQKLRVNCKD